jgi:hypothetical protein
MDTVERAVMRKQTKQFIDDNPITVTLYRPGAQHSDGAGGVTWDPGTDLAPQVMRLITKNQAGDSVSRTNVDGTTVQPDFVLLGEYDADVKNGDTFQLDGVEARVLYVRNDRRYETWAEVYRHG